MADNEHEEAIAIFSQAAEQMRFYRKHEWQITNYAVIAYAALAAAPLAVGSESWRTWVSWFAVVLVLLAAGQALRTLWYSNALRL